MKVRRLKIRALNEFSVVDTPANQHAMIALWKRATPENEMPESKDATGLLKKLAQALGFAPDVVVSGNVQKRVEQHGAKWNAYDEAGKMVGSFDSKEEAQAAAYGKREKKMADETVTKAEVEALQKRIEKAEAEATAAKADATAAKADATAQAEKVQKLETEQRDAEFTKRAAGYTALPVKANEFAVILRKAADVLTTEENAELDRVLTAASEAMKASGLMKEHGSEGATEGTAAAKVAAKVDEAKKADPKLTDVQARAKVYKADPALRREVENEQRASARSQEN